MTENKKHQLDELAVSDILSYLGARVSSMEEYIRRREQLETRQDALVLPKDILGLWEQTICEIRAEIKSWDLIGPHTTDYAKGLCDKLEHSMCGISGGNYPIKYQIEGALRD